MNTFSAKMRTLMKKLLKKHKCSPEGMDDAVQIVIPTAETPTDETDAQEDGTKVRVTPVAEPPIDETRLSYKFNYPSIKRSGKSILAEIAEFLFSKGFVFCSASTSGGYDEIVHAGDMSYSVTYRDFTDFCENFEDDFAKAEETERKKSGGWITSLNFEKLNIYLKRGDLRVHIAVGKEFRVQWHGVSGRDDPIFAEVNEAIVNVLGGYADITEEDCPKYEDDRNRECRHEETFLRNWD